MKAVVEYRVPIMRRLHVLRRLHDRDIKIQLEAQDRSRDEHDKDRKSCVLKIRHLDLHRPELDPPADIGVGGGRLEADVLPVCGLEVFEVVGFGEVEVFEVLGEDDEGVADKEVGEVGGEEGVHTAVHEAGTEGGIDGEVRVMVFGPETGVFGYVGRVGGVAGFGDAPAIVLQGLIGVSEVRAMCWQSLPASSPSSSAVRSSTARLIWFHRTSVSTRKPL